ncbi:hypothetical protein ABPG74_007321 [Tetrahymena malaccensis]
MNIRYGVKLLNNFNKISKQSQSFKQVFNQPKFQAVSINKNMENSITIARDSVTPALTIATLFTGFRLNTGCFCLDDSQGFNFIFENFQIIIQHYQNQMMKAQVQEAQMGIPESDLAQLANEALMPRDEIQLIN